MPGYKWIASIFAILLAGCLIQDVVQGTFQNVYGSSTREPAILYRQWSI